jgi:hypothetical protein
VEGSNLSNDSEYNNNKAELNLALIPRKNGYLELNTITSRGFTLCHLNNVGEKVRNVKNTHSRDKDFHVYLVHDSISTAEVK